MALNIVLSTITTWNEDKTIHLFFYPCSSSLLPEMAKQNSPSLAEVVKRVAEQQQSQVSDIEKSKTVLFQLQVTNLV